MRTFRCLGVEIAAAPEVVFDYLARPETLPEWAHAFKAVNGRSATMATSGGSVEIGLRVEASRRQGTIDWIMRFPDGSEARACSRVVPGAEGRSVYSFVLLAPPLPLEQLEGALKEQSRTLVRELQALQRILDGR